MEPVLYRLRLTPQQVNRALRKETVADVEAMVDGSAWNQAWSVTQQLIAAGAKVDVAQMRDIFMSDLREREEETDESAAEATPVDPDKAARMRDRLQAAAMRRGMRSHPDVVDATPAESGSEAIP